MHFLLDRGGYVPSAVGSRLRWTTTIRRVLCGVFFATHATLDSGISETILSCWSAQ